MKLLRTLVLRPLARDPLRTALTIAAVALGVAVVVGIELAGDAAAGSFQSSLTTLLGSTDLQISANGGLDETWIATLTQLPFNARFSPIVESQVLTAFRRLARPPWRRPPERPRRGHPQPAAIDNRPIFLSTAEARRLHLRTGDSLGLRLPTGLHTFQVNRIIDSNDSEFAVIDIALAQQVLNRYGKLDRIDVSVSPQDQTSPPSEPRSAPRSRPAFLIDKPGARSNENQRMLRAFRWNLRVLSYISLVVGAFLIYNTISISVVRRRPEIGILRAIGTVPRPRLLPLPGRSAPVRARRLGSWASSWAASWPKASSA